LPRSVWGRLLRRELGWSNRLVIRLPLAATLRGSLLDLRSWLSEATILLILTLLCPRFLIFLVLLERFNVVCCGRKLFVEALDLLVNVFPRGWHERSHVLLKVL
jgi:hypothetical protein